MTTPTKCPLTAEELRVLYSAFDVDFQTILSLAARIEAAVDDLLGDEVDDTEQAFALWLADALDEIAAKDAEIEKLRAELDAAREAILLNTTRKETSDGKVIYLVDEETTYESDEDYPAIHAAHEAQRQKATAAPAEGDPDSMEVR